MLLDRGLLTRDGAVYRPTGPIEQLEMPETLQALVAARLDGLTADERHLVQDGAVLGKTFTKQGLSALTGMDAAAPRADPRLAPAQGGALRPGGSALARARPVRLPPGHRQAGRVRDDLAQGAQGQAPRDGRVPPHAAGQRRGRDRRGRRPALHRRARVGARRARRRGDPRQGARDARPRRRAGRVARGDRGGAAGVRAGRRPERRRARAGRAVRARRHGGADRRARRGRQSLLRARDRAVRGIGCRRMRPPGSRPASPR